VSHKTEQPDWELASEFAKALADENISQELGKRFLRRFNKIRSLWLNCCKDVRRLENKLSWVGKQDEMGR
jgi:hypothetical protein